MATSLLWSPFWMEEMEGEGPGRGERPERGTAALLLAVVPLAEGGGCGWAWRAVPLRPRTAAAAAAAVVVGGVVVGGAGVMGAAGAAGRGALRGSLAAMADQLVGPRPDGAAACSGLLPGAAARGLLPAGASAAAAARAPAAGLGVLSLALPGALPLWLRPPPPCCAAAALLPLAVLPAGLSLPPALPTNCQLLCSRPVPPAAAACAAAPPACPCMAPADALCCIP